MRYKCVKNKLKNIVIDGEAEGIVKETVLTVHRIAIHALQFIKLFLLDHYETHGSTPTVTRLLVMNCMAVVRESKEHKNTKNKADMAVLRAVFESKYKPTMHESDHAGMIGKNLTQVLDYCATGIVAEYETNITQHYVEYVERFVNVLFDKNEVAKDMDSAEKTQLYSHLRQCKRAVLERDEASLPPLLSPHYSKIKGPETQQRNTNYDIQCQPQAYLPSMIYMMKFVEGKGCKIANVFPMRTALIPKYITLDTATLVNLLMKKKHYTAEMKSKRDFAAHICDSKEYVWGLFFNTKLPCFSRTGYQFNSMIDTDGVGCSILLAAQGVAHLRSKARAPAAEREKYMDELDSAEQQRLQHRTVVGIDPGKNDLIYCVTVDGSNNEPTSFRYTAEQRKCESKQKKYRRTREKMKRLTFIDSKSVVGWEATLSSHNHKTLDPRRYVEYLRAKNRVNAICLPFYAQETFRKMRWHAYINMSRSESVMINRFKEKFGPPQDVVIAIGDWEQKHQARFKQPTKGVGMRKLFKKHGYADLFLVNEFRTSKKCYACGDGDGDCEKFLYAPRPKPCGDRHTCGCTSTNTKRARLCAKKHEPALVHGLVRCTTCTRIWNRDVNGSLNIFSIATLALHNQARPRHLSRERKRQDAGDDNAPAKKKPKTITAGPMTAEPPTSGLLGGQDQK